VINAFISSSPSLVARSRREDKSTRKKRQLVPSVRRKCGGEGRDSNPRVVFATATGKPVAALANGDLSELVKI
jgi:hypothetical protein